MLRRTVLKLLGAVIAAPIIGWPVRKIAQAANWNVWIGRFSGDWCDPRNWSLGVLPTDGETVVFDSCSGHLTTNLDHSEMNLRIDRLVITEDFKGTIGEEGRPL